MSVLTLTGVGYGEVHALSRAGRWLMIAVMLINNAIFLYAVASISALILEGDLMNVFNSRKLIQRLDQLKGHVIIVGLGRVGQRATKVLLSHGRAVVGIDKEPAKFEIYEESGGIIISGDGLDENLLRAVGIERADTLCACLPNESDNLALTITAKDFNPDIKIIARANSTTFRQRLRKAGADNVILPEVMAGTRFALESLDENVEKYDRFLEFHAASKTTLEQVRLNSSSPLIGKTVLEAQIRSNWNITVFFINAADGHYEAHIPVDRVFREGDELWLIGTKENLSRFIQNMV
jgi:voltage-gated potassium channel